MNHKKTHKEILNLFPKETKFYFCSSSNERVLEGKELQKIAKSHSISGASFTSVVKGYKNALKNASKEDIVVVTGSNFVVADIL